MNWTRIPDLVCAVLMIWAFGSVAQDKQKYVARVWMAGWVMILVYSLAALFTHLPGIWGGLDYVVFSVALASAGLLFAYASMPERERASSLWLLVSLQAASLVYMGALVLSSGRAWAMDLAAVLVTVLPLAVILASLRSMKDKWRWAVLGICGLLTIFLLMVQNRRPYGVTIAWNGFLFVAYIGACLFAFCTYRRATAGAFVTVAGFFGWSLVYVLEPMQQIFWPRVPIENEIWHLPAFVVAIGMMLLLLEDQLKHSRHLALHDELTGLPNRRLFQDRLESALARARRTREPLALLSIDLDEFKKVNDTLGHQAGDLLLQRVGALFDGRIRSSDTVARTGGDEFCVILENLAGRADAERVRDSLGSLLQEPVQVGDHSIRVGASIGVAAFPEDGEDVDTLCRVADMQMYAEKHGINARAGDAGETAAANARIETPQVNAAAPTERAG